MSEQQLIALLAAVLLSGRQAPPLEIIQDATRTAKRILVDAGRYGSNGNG